MKLKELRRYLGNGKLKFLEQERNRHLHYLPRLDDKVISLPTILAVSQGDGDADFVNVKGVARSLGLKLKELETSEACRIGRECVLLLLAWEMLGFCIRRQQEVGNSPNGVAGVKAMAISIGLLLDHVETHRPASWRKEESQALNRISPEVKAAQENVLLRAVIERLLAAIQRD